MRTSKNIFVGLMGDEGVETFLNVSEETSHPYLNTLDLRCRFNSHRHIFIFMVVLNNKEKKSALETFSNGNYKSLMEELMLYESFSVNESDTDIIKQRFKNIIIKRKTKSYIINNRMKTLFD